ncbi:hypothetical protein ACHQM5_013475 [Ranunculus cassubicifolius]
MRRRTKEKSQIQIPKLKKEDQNDNLEAEDEESKGGGFFACYLLCSMCPRFKGHTYIGFTVNPRRRIRQHNGELRSGAWRTKSKRPWEMILCIYGFPTNVTALQFEWAWQHPTESLAVRGAAASLKSLSGIVGKIKLAYTMLTLPTWEKLNLTVNFFSTKYMKDAVGCKTLPKQMKVQFSPMDDLPCYTGGEQILDEMDDQDIEDEDAENDNDNKSAPNTSDYEYGQMLTDPDLLKSSESEVIMKEPLSQKVEDDLISLEESRQEVPYPSSHRVPYDIFDSPPISRTVEFGQSCKQLIEDDSISLREESRHEVAYTLSHRVPYDIFDSPATSRTAELGQSSKQLVSSPIAAKNQLLFSLYDTPVKTLDSSNFGMVEIDGDRDSSGLIQESIDLELSSSKQTLRTKSFASTNSLNTNIEVIDISTPSPNLITHAFRQKKKRNNWVNHEVIDLTK